ncbi:SAM-dependent methyltransferase [Candidatus Woesearchaeota archaeon]|nr:SAM-dependent methyltransferase [Candidatus Woesearchaeota archaeon]
MNMLGNSVSGSFRDPSGFVFLKDGSIYRQINAVYKDDYDFLIKSGLYKTLVDSNLMIAHDEADIPKPKRAYKVIKPEMMEFISYPYEWSFSQLKDAALTTLKIQQMALDFKMSLKDCSSYNIQFRKCKPILIDSLSFEKYKEKKQWSAPYSQFCRHFLAPLSLMSYVDVRLNNLLRVYIDGIPLDLASSLLPFKTYFNFLFFHIHLNAKLQNFANKNVIKKSQMNRKSLSEFIYKLEYSIKNMNFSQKTEWDDYYDTINYSSTAFKHKKYLVSKFLKLAHSKVVMDLGSNIGVFSRIANDMGMKVISVDNDPNSVGKNYMECIKRGETNILPLLIDLTNPSPDIGWDNEERTSFFKRNQSDTVLALALLHHLAISNNLPFNKLAKFFNKICSSLIIEFASKNDSQIKKMLFGRKEIFPYYKQEIFEKAFNKYFTIARKQKIRSSKRYLYLMNTKNGN